MAAKELSAGITICEKGQPINALHIIASGSVKAVYESDEITLRKGDIVGLIDISRGEHSFSYVTLENSSFISFSVKDADFVTQTVQANPEIGKMMFVSMANQMHLLIHLALNAEKTCRDYLDLVNSIYEDYRDICTRSNIISRSYSDISVLEKEIPVSDVSDDVVSYYDCIKDFPSELKHPLSARVPFLKDFLYRGSRDFYSFLPLIDASSDYRFKISDCLLKEDGEDLLSLFTQIITRIKNDSPEYDKLTQSVDKIFTLVRNLKITDESVIEMRKKQYDERKLLIPSQIASANSALNSAAGVDLSEAVDTILDYADMSDEFKNEFKINLAKYKRMPDKGATDDASRKLRQALTSSFYKLYEEAFQLSVKDQNLPKVMKMFFNFGFVDAELAGPNNAAFLYTIADDFKGDPELSIYTAYEWLMEIYHLHKDPSRNEYDADFLTHLHELKMQGKIPPELEKRLARDPGERVLYELTNMFQTVNKITYGRITTFTPLLCEDDIIKPLQNCMVTVDAVIDALKKVQAVDYGAFYRETIYVNERAHIANQFICTKVTPNVILFPNAGTRGIMWQEIEGKKRTTPARFMVSAFHMEDLQTTVTRLIGEFRWEMCKREQGARWNDVSERSLTSEYFDYIQFYRKNSELSIDAKEKIKQSLVKAKNSFKEMFVRDYITWVLYEGTGSPRLNKVARAILLTYCPFPKSLRDRLSPNPIFKELIERYDIKTTQKLHSFDNILVKLKNSGEPITPELQVHRAYLEGTVEE